MFKSNICNIEYYDRVWIGLYLCLIISSRVIKLSLEGVREIERGVIIYTCNISLNKSRVSVLVA